MRTKKSIKSPTPQQLRKIAVLSYELGIVQPDVRTYNNAYYILQKLKKYKRELEELPKGTIELVLSEDTLDTFSSGEDWMRAIEERVDIERAAKQVRIVDIVRDSLFSLNRSYRNALILSLTKGTWYAARKIGVTEEEVERIRDQAYLALLEDWEERATLKKLKALPAFVNFNPYILFIADKYYNRLNLRKDEVDYRSNYTLDMSRIVYDNNPYLTHDKFYWRVL